MSEVRTSRAIVRVIEPGNEASCPGCGQRVKFQARKKNARQIICNVYVECDCTDNSRCQGFGQRWDRVEHWHPECYDTAGKPHGEPLDKSQRWAKERKSA